MSTLASLRGNDSTLHMADRFAWAPISSACDARHLLFDVTHTLQDFDVCEHMQAAREWDLAPAAAKAPTRPSGAGAAKLSPVPKRVVQLSDILSVAAGAHHTVVACARGVYSFGCNSHGQLGLGTCVDSPVPVRVKTLSQSRDNVTQVRPHKMMRAKMWCLQHWSKHVVFPML